MAVELPETTIIEIRKNLIEVGEQLDQAIVDENLSIKNKEDEREKVWKENIIEKTKTTLSNDEKKRLFEVSRIFVKEWVDQIKKLKEQQKKKDFLSGTASTLKKKVTAPFQFVSDLFKNKKKKEEPKKEGGMSWLTKLLLIIGGLAAAWFLFKDHIKDIPEKILAPLRGLKDSAIDLIKGAWDDVCATVKEKLTGAWEWVKTTLHLDELGKFFTDSWNKVEGWFDTIWNKIETTWTECKNEVINFPGKMWTWIQDTAKELFDPVIKAITDAWNIVKDKVLGYWEEIKNKISEWWEGLKKAWKNVCDFFDGIWKWITDTFSFDKLWKCIKEFASGRIDDIKEDLTLLFTGHIKELAEKYVNRFISIFTKIIDKAKTILGYVGVDFGDNTEETSKEQVTTKIATDVQRVIEKQDEIELKDNILDTIKSICDRINVFFSGNKNGFIELSNRLVNQVSSGFTDLQKQLEKVELKNIYNLEQENNYHDSYDQSDKSVKTINNDYSKHSNDDYGITYNSIDIPALNNAISALEKQNEEEIKLLTSQNDYLSKMINNIDGLGDKLTWLDKKEYKPQQNNAIIPILAGLPNRPGMKLFDTSDLRMAQQRYAAALNA